MDSGIIRVLRERQIKTIMVAIFASPKIDHLPTPGGDQNTLEGSLL